MLAALNFLRALYSTFLASLFGVLQILVIYFFSQLSVNKSFRIIDFYEQGFFLFFTVAIISGVLIEYFIDAKVKTNVYVNSFILITGVLICLFCMLAYSKIFLQFESTDVSRSIVLQDNFLIIGVLASVFLKWIIYTKKTRI
ncbi:MAG: hypothetical protein ACOYXT_07395 [Bacteroidota bacterium]